jgi:hypothetical protein
MASIDFVPSSAWALRWLGVSHSVAAMSSATIGSSSEMTVLFPWIACVAPSTYFGESPEWAATCQRSVSGSKRQSA